VCGALAQGLAVGLAGTPDVCIGDRGERDQLDAVDLDQTVRRTDRECRGAWKASAGTPCLRRTRACAGDLDAAVGDRSM
jgi:hypothetical protein